MPDPAARQVRNGIAFLEKGEGEPLLLIHGVGLNAEAWGPQIEALSDTHRVIALDMPGHGGSALTGGELAAYVAQAVTLLDALGIPSANVVGHSMGAATALAIASELAPGKEALILRTGGIISGY